MYKFVKSIINKVSVASLAVFALLPSLFASSISGIQYSGASSAKMVDGEVVLVFTDTEANGTFTLPMNAKARVVTVAGGGAGGSMAAVDEIENGAAGGGGGGGVSDHETILEPGTYTVKVGKGGQKVQTIVQAWVGANGENSMVEYDGSPIFNAKGGGGGGSVKINGMGNDGGCGGGGSWFNGFTKAGAYVDGQGWGGAVATNSFIGGGGGGAHSVASNGIGLPNGAAGAGRLIDITGDLEEYGRGGNGGNRNSETDPQDGEGYGWGGDGANTTGRGGKGGDGIVIVRIHRQFEFTEVPFPEVQSFEWEEGRTYVEFNPATAPEPLRSAIAYIEGVTVVTCSVDTVDGQTVTNGLGRFWYAIHLKDEYIWEDGSTTTKTIYWRVKENGTIGEASVDVTKTVEWSSGKNAVIAIDIHTTPEKIENIPNVLFVGSLCSAHGYSPEIARTAINSVTKVGNIDYYFFNTTSELHPAADVEGHLLRGEAVTGDIPMKSSNHGSVYGFYEAIANAIDSGKEYDYVIFSFDRDLTATAHTSGAHTREEDVANWLIPFYENNAVIWLVDNTPPNDTDDNITQTPWYPSQLVAITVSNSTSWNSLYYYYYTYVNTSGNNRTDTAYNNSRRAYRSLIGLFTPRMFASFSDTTYQNNYNFYTRTDERSNSKKNAGTIRTQVAALAGDTNPNQVVYNNAKNVADVIEAVVQVKPATIQMNDRVHVGMGLAVQEGETYGMWTTNETAIGWIPLVQDDSLFFTDACVDISIPGIVDPCEIKLYIAVEDTGSFRSSINAKYNERTGLWEKDPNDGPVIVSITPDGSTAILDEAEAETAVAWSFPTYRITGSVVHGEGEIVLNGFIINSVNVAEGTSPEVVFRGAGGYVLDYLEVDGQVINDFDKDCYNWYFLDVAADHDIKVGFKSVFSVPYPNTTPRVETYDGTPYGPYCSEPTFLPGYDYEWFPVYSTDPDGEFTTTGGVTTVKYDANGNPMPQTVYTRICIMQPGYEDGVVLNDWMGESTVTILPRPITVKFDDYAQTTTTRKTEGFSYQIISGTLVEGDTLDANSGRCTSYPSKGSRTTGSITSSGEMSVTTPDCDENNYAITVVPGDYYYPDHDIVANAQSIIKVYDGVSESIDVDVLFPVNSQTTSPAQSNWSSWSNNRRTSTITWTEYKVSYSTDGGNTWTETNPEFVDVSNNTIQYKVEYVECSQTVTQTRRSSWSTNYTTTTGETQRVEWTPYTGSANITILKRPVTVTAASAEKVYDTLPLNGSIASITGFVDGEGFQTINVTPESTITNPGSTTSTIDAENAVLKSNTKADNYDITYVNGKLTVIPNPINATATSVVKVYDGTPAPQIVVTPTFTNGTEFTEGTIYYRTSPTGEWSTTPPATPTDAGEYPIYYKVDGGGYGTVEGVTTITVTPRTVKLQADNDDKYYDGEPLTNSEFTVVNVVGNGCGFVGDEGITKVTMTEDSVQTEVGEHSNRINVYDTENWEMKPGTKIQNYVFEVLPGTLKVKGGFALMITDHRSEVAGKVDLCTKVQWSDTSTSFKDWYSPTNFAAKIGNTLEGMEESEPVEAEVVDVLMDETTVWLRIPFDVNVTNNYIRTFAYGHGVSWKHSNGKDVLNYIDAKGAKSINIHALLKVDVATTNTMTAIPWKWYSEKPEEALDIPARKLVNTMNLESGDTLLRNAGYGTYYAWYMVAHDWISVDTIKIGFSGIEIIDEKQENGYMVIRADDMTLPITNQLPAVRGYAMWLVRNNPVNPFWLYGQYTDVECVSTVGAAPVEITGNASKDVTSTTLGNPFNEIIELNKLEFRGDIHKDDRVWIPNGTESPVYLMYNEKAGWCYSMRDPKTRRTMYVSDIKLNPGLGFWYDRRGSTPLTIKWVK